MNVEQHLPAPPKISEQTERMGWITAVVLFVFVDAVMTAGGYYAMMLQVTPIWAETNPVMLMVVGFATDVAAALSVYSPWGKTAFVFLALFGVKSIAVGSVYAVARWSSKSGARYASVYTLGLTLTYGAYTLIHNTASFASVFL